MRFKVVMHDPDGLFQGAIIAARNECRALNLTGEELDLVINSRLSKALDGCSRWFEYGEYLTVEIDTDAGTCAVLEMGK